VLTVKTRVMIWGRAAARCSLPECRRDLVMDATETDDPSLVGEICHIVAESEDGPRGDSPLTKDERNRYDNLILMCSVHHKLIDDQPNTYSVNRLHELKSSHEQFVKASLGAGEKDRQKAEEVVAGYVDIWSERCGLEQWNAWTSSLLTSQPSIHPDRFDTLKSLPEWLLSRIWPKGLFPDLAKAMANFRQVLNDLLNVFEKRSEKLMDEGLIYLHITKKFYKIDEWNEDLYFKLGREYDCHVCLISDYVYELTRAANYVCGAVREELLPSFRLEQGALLVTRDMDMNLQYHTYRPEYRGADFPDLYQGRIDFNRRRLTRDVYDGDDKEAEFLEDLNKARRFPPE
jgi:hypothetical protein